MATAHHAPNPDLFSLDELSELFAETGRPAPKSTLRRWIQEAGIPTVRADGRVYASYSDLLIAHALHQHE